jgi:anaerobic ribonucleoside-triphosphate reductase activating protein
VCDVLVDGPYVMARRDTSLPFRGSSNQRLIDVKESLKKGMAVIYEKI